MKRRFNTAGPCRPDWHYMIPAERRLKEAPSLVEQRGYFVVHAPRQTGKTTALRSLAARLTEAGHYAALLFSCEAGEAAGDDYGAAEQLVLADMTRKAESALPPELRPPEPPPAPPGSVLGGMLAAWARRCPRPLVLMFDEIDSLRGQSLISVLRQLRSGYAERPHAFPSSVILCGMRDVRDYKAASGGDPERLGTASPFNIKLESVRVGDFTREELGELYAQHTEDTGQVFTEEGVSRAWEATAGQPWLVNALGREIVEKMAVPAAEPIEGKHVQIARERLILARATHLDSLAHRLVEPRVRRVIEPVLAGTYEGGGDSYEDDLSYARDLGLVAPDRPLRIANPIYREVVARVLSSAVEDRIPAEPSRFLLPDGRLAWRRLLRAFAAFWSEHGEILSAGVPYPEVAPQLVLMAFLQRVVNGGGTIDREYGVGRGRIDLLVRFPYRKADGAPALQRRAMELKVWRRGERDPLRRGLAQLDEYLARLRLRRGTLVVFDARDRLAARRPRFEQATTPAGRDATVLRA
ncbi:AAA family ATPase [Sorangium cellulosum]|uniref:AAA family ATPase n=1 Tax=Sorangium cellulosum TaxID=56 RepID=A0A150TYC2_SORCE|nr:AAA family ATPase [Sorangium cellulosum]